MAKYFSKGTTLSVDMTGEGTYTKLVQLTSVDGPSSTVDSVQVTDLDSTHREYRPGLPDSGEISCECWFDPGDAGHVFLQGAADSPDVYSWQVSIPTLPKAKLFTVDGFVTEFSPKSGAPGDYITASIKIKTTAAVVVTTAP